MHKKIEFKDIRFKYSAEDKYVFQNLNLVLEKGQTMGTRIHPMLEAKSVELSAPKRGDNDSFFACCCLC